MGRPTGEAWAPLGLDDDPTPGNPGRVTDEVSHLSSVATTIANQIAALKQIAGDDSDPLVGKYAEKIKETAKDLADTLDKVHDRYTKVASALGGWESDLVTAQAMSLKALDEAEAPYHQLQLLNGPTISAPPPAHPTAAQQQAATQAATAHKAAVSKAQGQLNDAVTDLHKATQFRDDRANYWAGKINNASDDGLKDSWWDSFKDFIGKWAWALKDICTVLEVIGAVLAIIALFASGAFLLIAFIVTAAALLLRTVLAATGNGSWLDVAIDAFALLTLGLAGGLDGAGGAVGAAEDATKEAPEAFNAVQDTARAESVESQASSMYSRQEALLRGLSDDFGGDSEFDGLADQAAGKSEQAAADAAARYPTSETALQGVKEAGFLGKLRAGSPELAEYLGKLNALKGALAPGESVAQISEGLAKASAAQRYIFSGLAVSVGGLAASGLPAYGPGAADFGGEAPFQQLYEFQPFQAADEAMKAGIPDSFMNALTSPTSLPPTYSYTYSQAIP
jgi:hypothetical protein